MITLRDAAIYITKLPKAEHDATEWQAAMEALLLVVERGGDPMFARIGVMRALNRRVEHVFSTDRRASLGSPQAGKVSMMEAHKTDAQAPRPRYFSRTNEFLRLVIDVNQQYDS